MRLNRYFRRSISRQFVFLMGIFIFLFVLGTGLIYVTQNVHYNQYVETRSKLVQKEKLAIEIHNTYNQVLSDFRGYFAYGNHDLRTSAYSSHPEIRKLMKELEKMELTAEDREYNRELRLFTTSIAKISTRVY